jgi:hypothetical protein
MYQHPTFVQGLIRDRVAELQRTATAAAARRDEPRANRVIVSARRTTGWLLVDMGLRLAVPRAPLNHPAARGPR